MKYTYETNPYYCPKDSGLEILTTIDTAGDYEFDMIVVWKKTEDETIWYDFDSGCSCPTPFEDAELKQITNENYDSFKQRVEGHYNISRNQIFNILDVVKRNLK